MNSYFCSEQSSDFFHQLYNYSKNTLLYPTKYTYLESTRRDLQNDNLFVNFELVKKFLKIKKKNLKPIIF